MAITIDSISSITKRYFFPSLVDEVTTSMALLMKMKEGGRMVSIDGGTQIYQPVDYARNTSVMNYSGDETLDVAYNEKRTALVFDWKQKSGAITLTGLDTIKNAGAAKVIDHLTAETNCAKRDIKDSFATGLYSAGTDAKEITGAQVFVATSSSYGGLSQSTESWLQAKVDSTTPALSLGKMQERWEACKEDNDKISLVTTTETLYNSFWSLLQPQQRFSDNSTAKAGFENLMFNSAPVLEDSYCPSSSMYFWNLKHLKLVSSKQRPFPGSLQPFVKPTNQDAKTALILWAGELVCEEPRKFGVMSALTS